MTTTWEYRLVAGADEAALAGLGREGWELVAVVGAGDAPVCYLKRPAPDFRTRVTLDQRRAVFAERGLAESGAGEGKGR